VGIREKLNEKPAITTGVTIGIIVIAFAFILYQVFGGDGSSVTIPDQFYTVDEGATRFTDDPSRAAPFQHEGKEAVRAFVYTCDENKTSFVGYLERLSPEAKKKYDALPATSADSPPSLEADTIMSEGSEVKKPKVGKWVKRNSAEGEKITNVTCPNNTGVAQMVEP
jgi:hypothetical protein